MVSEDGMNLRKKKNWMLFISLVGFVLLCIHPVYAGDELLLTGRVKSVDESTRIITIDVSSASCKGVRTFTVDDVLALSEFQDFVNQKVEFFINSSTCKRGEVHTILPKWRLRK
jgi:hypothetical protein